MPPPETVRVGIVGIGFGQRVLLPAFRADPRAKVVAICASTEERARAVATRESIPLAFGDWRQLLDREVVDVVAIAVPPALQPEIAAAAVKRGIHLFCEKPAAVNTEQALELRRAADAAGVIHAMDFEFCELPSWQRARQVIAEGRLGRLRGFVETWHVETRAHREQTLSWKQRSDQGGGALSSFASHSLFLIEWMLGPISELSARLWPPDGSADSRVIAALELEGRAGGTISIATDAVAGTGHRLEVHGSEGSLLLENSSRDHLRNFVLTLGTPAQERATLVDERSSDAEDGRIQPVGALVRRFVDAVLGGTPVRPNLEDGVRVQTLIEAIRSSHRSGAWSKV